MTLQSRSTTHGIVYMVAALVVMLMLMACPTRAQEPSEEELSPTPYTPLAPPSESPTFIQEPSPSSSPSSPPLMSPNTHSTPIVEPLAPESSIHPSFFNLSDCTQISGHLDTFSGHSRVSFVDNGMRITPLLNGQEVDNAYASIEWLGVQEFWRDGDICAEPDGFPVPDPKFRVTVVQTMDIRSMQCQLEMINEEVAEDVLMRTMHVYILDPSMPQFYMEFNVSTTSKPINITYDHPSVHVAHYREESFKFTYAVENWPWAYHNNESYLTSSWRTKFGVPSTWDYITINGNNMSQTFVATQDGRINVHQIFDTIFYTESKTLVRGPRDAPIYNFSNLPAMTWDRVVSFSFCELYSPNLHYKTLRYDPSLSILLMEPSTPPTTSSPTSKSKKGVMIAYIVVPIVVIVAALVGAVLIWQYRKKMMQAKPNNLPRATSPGPLTIQRTNHTAAHQSLVIPPTQTTAAASPPPAAVAATTATTSPKQSGWSRASKPPTLSE